MKRVLLVVFSMFFSFPVIGVAANSSFLGQGPTPKQAMVDPESEATAMKKVKEIMEQSKKEVAEQKKRSQSAAKTVQENSKKAPLTQVQAPKQVPEQTPNKNAASTKSINTQLSELGQANLLFQQRVDQQIENITTQNQQLRYKLTKLEQAIAILNHEMTRLSQPKPTSANGGVSAAMNTAHSGSSWWEQIDQRFGNALDYGVFGVLLLLAVFVGYVIPRRRKEAKQFAGVSASTNNTTEDDDTEDEYDFMGSKEAIPAKLDLARAYVAMEDFDEACKVLEQVSAEGDASQRKEAKELLDTIEAKQQPKKE